MDEEKLNALRICGPMIIQSLDVDIMTDYLFSKGWITQSEVNQLALEKLPQTKARYILHLLRLRPSPAFDDFMSALDMEGSFLAQEIRKHLNTVPSHRRREHSLTNVREALIEGAVPDTPNHYVNRCNVNKQLSSKLRDLANHFRAPDVSAYNFGYKDAKTVQPPPTNAWLLVCGAAGSGKTVLASSVLRQEFDLILDCFPGGIIWLTVGPVLSSAVSDFNAHAIQIVDRLEFRVNLSGNRFVDLPEKNDLTLGYELVRPRSSISGILSPSSSIDGALDRLRRALIRRQQRTSWGPDEGNCLLTSLLLIVLDDVWDAEIVKILSTMPSAFLVTSRDAEVLARIEAPTSKLHLYHGLSEIETADLLSTWTDFPKDHFMTSNTDFHNNYGCDNCLLNNLAQLTYGSPLAVNLLGNLIHNHTHRLYDFVCDWDGMGRKFINWYKITRPSSYKYDSVHEAYNDSIALLSPNYRKCYQRLVIFDSCVILNPKMCGIVWELSTKEADHLLTLLLRYSLCTSHWLPKFDAWGYTINGLQLDLLKSSVDPIDQALYHDKLIHNYSTFCNGRWLKLVSHWEHNYFWQHAVDHLFRAGNLKKLLDLLTDLNFIHGRLRTVGSTLVIADFRRFRLAFVTMSRLDDWLAYLRFVQTDAHYVIDPIIMQQCDRSRPLHQESPTHSRTHLDLSPPGYRPDSGTAFYPDSRPASVKLTPSLGGAGRGGPKGVDLLQLGLGLSRDNPVFKQALRLLLDRRKTALECKSSGSQMKSASQFKYYWFWCNSHIAASQLVWAMSTGSQAVTCLAIEQYDAHSTTNKQYRQRYLAGTSDGRVLLLDANSGYEVALHNVYPEDTEVKYLSFLSNNIECLTCGSNGSLVISTLPPAELIEANHKSNGDSLVDDHESLDVDAIEDNDDTISLHGSFSHVERLRDDSFCNNHTCVDTYEDLQVFLRSDNAQETKLRPTASPTSVDVKSPIVLAELPCLMEIARVDGGQEIPTSITTIQPAPKGNTFFLQSVCAAPSVDLLIMGGEGVLDNVMHRVDGINLNIQDQFFNLPKLPNVYHIRRSAKKLRLDCSRQLRFPQLNSNSLYAKVCSNVSTIAHLSCVSSDGQFIAVCLSDGFIWVYDLESVSWFSCISTKLATVFKHQDACNVDIFKAPRSLDPNMVDIDLDVGPAPSCIVFLPQSSNYENSTILESSKIYLAASISTEVIVWYLPNSICFDTEDQLVELNLLKMNSFPQLRMSCDSGATILCMDTCIVDEQHILAGGTSNGRVLIWRLSDGCRLMHLSVHSSWVTAVRLLPRISHSVLDDNGEDSWLADCCPPITPTESYLPIGLLTASDDGVIKRWDVGCTCLPSAITPSPTANVCPTFPLSIRSENSTLVRSENSSLNSTLLHGLWTEVISVSFGRSNSLIVVGRCQHSANIQFLFRPEQHAAHLFDSFQEITIRPSQMYFWHPSVCDRGHTSTSGFAKNIINKHSEEKTCKNRKLTINSVKNVYGLATAISFSSDGYWVVVGFNTGNLMVYSLHFDSTHLYGIVRRFCLLSSIPEQDSTLWSGNLSSLERVQPVDSISHVHIWTDYNKPSIDTDLTSLSTPSLVVVVGVYTSGIVKAWYMTDVVHCLSDPSAVCKNLSPSDTWSKLHTDAINQTKPVDTNHEQCESNKVNQSNCYPISPADSLITWSTCCMISPGVSLAHTDTPMDSINFNRQKALIWLTAGRDGYVYGRELPVVKQIHKSTSSNIDSKLWELNLSAHTPMTITDAEVDSLGHWLLTGSTDRTARIWSLSTGLLVFDTGKHPTCVRTVCFRPKFLTGPSDLDEHIIATGDDSGVLRIWCLTNQTLMKRIDHRHYASDKQLSTDRAVSPESFHSPKRSGGYYCTGLNSNTNRVPSPDKPARSSAHRLPKRPDFFSTAAGYGCTWLHKLVWSPDGSLLTGISDRLCVWPFAFNISSSSTQKLNNNFELYQCRVLRVLSSGVHDSVGTSKPLAVGPTRVFTATDALDTLPPTIVTVDCNTGTLYIFDPIGALFQSVLTNDSH